MKMLYTKDLKRLLEDGTLETQDLFDLKDETAGPCREIKFDREKGYLLLLVDRKELMKQTLDILGITNLTMEFADKMLALWRNGQMEELRKLLKLGDL